MIKAFIDSVQNVIEKDSNNVERIQQEIETAYDYYIVNAGISKADFLARLYEQNKEIHELTVDHLFTPVHWSKVTIRNVWGLKNTATGNLISLCANGEEDDSFILRDNDKEFNHPPMLTDDHSLLANFLTIIKNAYENKSVSMQLQEVYEVIESSLTVIDLEFNNINPANLKVVKVQIIY